MDKSSRLASAKRKRSEEEEDEFETAAKKISNGTDEEDVDLALLGDLDENAIAELVASAPEVEKIDSAGVKRLVLNFESAYTENTKMREKYANDPEKFVESEMKLDQAIRNMQAIATAPEHYIELLRNGTHDSILSLLSHDNTDIVIGIIDLLRDFLASDDTFDNDEVDEFGDEEDRLIQRELATQTTRVFTSQLLKFDLIPLLVACVLRFDENIDEEKQGVYDALELFENLLEVASDETCQLISERTKFVKFLVERLSSSKFATFDDVKLYASEILCILAQSSPSIQAQIGKEKGLDLLLQTLSYYLKNEPKVGEEEEMIENICNTLCVTATNSDNRALFLQSEGLELVKLLLKSAKHCKRGAAKILSFYLLGDLRASAHWLDIGGLGTLFSAFMHQSKVIKNPKRKKNGEEFEDEEHIISALAALLTNFKDAIQEAQSHLNTGGDEEATADEGKTTKSSNGDGSPSASETISKYSGYIERVVLKFAENNCEKLVRLIDLHKKYMDRMTQIDANLRANDNEDEGRDENDEDQLYEDRLEAGLSTLQFIDYIMAFVSNSLPAIKQRATKYLKEKDSSWTEVKSVLLEYSVKSAAENGEDPEEATGESAYIRGLSESISEM